MRRDSGRHAKAYRTKFDEFSLLMLVSPDSGKTRSVQKGQHPPKVMKMNTVVKADSVVVSALRIPVVVGLLLLSCFSIFGQQSAPATNSSAKTSETKTPEAKPGVSKSAAKAPFTLSVKTKPILNISLKAEKAKLSEIGDALSRRLKIPVLLGPSMETEIVSTEFSELTLETAVQLLAPSVYIDYEIKTSPAAQPRPLGIFLYGSNQGEPPTTAVVHGATQSLLIEGDTEEGVEPDTEEERKRQEEQPLKVNFLNNFLSVKSKKQPLVLVLLKIGEHLGIPVDIQYQPPEIVDLELNKMPVEDAIRALSPSIQMYVRADLTRSERRVLRLVLTEQAKTTQPGF
jgi:hypothetical protein